MKPHKHAELIKAWADGAEIQYLAHDDKKWYDCKKPMTWYENDIYRIKPEPKPDVVRLYAVMVGGGIYESFKADYSNLKLTFDGETGELKSAEVLK